jgi:formate hydrogenlyase subunit 3/multisubunit Na+/H+ antiporter MnhD subunit
MSIVTLAYLLKVQRHVFSGPAQSAPVRTPALMIAAMVVLALLCVGMAFLVVPGLDAPFLVGPAADVLLRGAFEL